MYRKRSRYSRAKASRVPAGVKEYVKQAVHAGREMKVASPRQYGDVAPFNLSESMVFRDLMPVIANGSLVSNRIGNKIRPKKAYLHLQLSQRPQTAATDWGPVYVDIYIVKTRNDNLPPDPTTFLDNGALAQAYDSNVSFNSGLLDVNTDINQLKFRKRVLLMNSTNTGFLTTNGSTTQSFSMSIDCTKYLKSTLMFDDIATTPTNDNLYLGLACTRSTGPIAGILAQANCTFHLKYEDA